MKMQTKMMFESNDVKIYDVRMHRSFWVNRNDIDVTATIKHGYPDMVWTNYGYVFVRDWAIKKTPNSYGFFAVSARTYEKFSTVPRKDW